MTDSDEKQLQSLTPTKYRGQQAAQKLAQVLSAEYLKRPLPEDSGSKAGARKQSNHRKQLNASSTQPQIKPDISSHPIHTSTQHTEQPSESIELSEEYAGPSGKQGSATPEQQL